MRVFATIALLSLVSCAVAPLSPEEASVRILRRSDAPKKCKELGRVHASGYASITEEGRDSDLKKATYKLGGDTVSILDRDSNNTVYGMAYKCN